MNDRIQDLENHYIVCGGGETGRHIIGELLGSELPVVLIEQDEALVAQHLTEEGLFCIAGTMQTWSGPASSGRPV